MLRRKTRLALEALIRRARADAIRAGRKPFAVDGYRAIVDRLHLTAAEFPVADILAVGEYRSLRSHRIVAKNSTQPYGYGRVRILKNEKTGTELAVLSEPRKPWLAAYRYEFRGPDSTGIKPEDVWQVLQFLRSYRLVLVELAVDFSLNTGVDENTICRHARFGKSRTNRDDRWPTRHTWGARKGGKFIRTYFKPEIAAHRIEVQLGSRLLKKLRIRDVHDFERFADVIPGQIQFVEIDKTALEKRLRRQGRREWQIGWILRQVGVRESELDDALLYVRRSIRLTNVHRLLVRLEKFNGLVRSAVKRWAVAWPQPPSPLRSKHGTKQRGFKEANNETRRENEKHSND